MANRKRTLVPEARTGLSKFKVEVANELGITDYEHIDKGNLTSRENGSVGGLMVKHMVEAFEEGLSK